MHNISRRSFLGVTGVAALGVAAGPLLAGCSGSAPTAASSSAAEAASSAAEAASSAASASAAQSSAAAAEAFKTAGKGEKLLVGRRGKLFKIAPSVIAEEMGYYKEEGCDVEFQMVELAEAFASLASDNLDVMLMGVVQTCEYISKGTDLYIFGGTVLNGTEILAPADSNLTFSKPEDFKGLNIGFHRPETGQIRFRAWLLDNGITLNVAGEGPADADIVFTPLDNEQALVEATAKGEVDICLVNNAFGYIGKDSGINVVGNVPSLAGNYPCCRQNASNNAYHNKYLSLVDFEIAILRGYKVFKEDPEKTVEIMVRYSEQKEDVVRAGLYGTSDYETQLTLLPDPCRNAVLGFYDSMKTVGAIDASARPADDNVVSDIYRTALDTLMEREPNEQFWKDLDKQYKENNE